MAVVLGSSLFLFLFATLVSASEALDKTKQGAYAVIMKAPEFHKTREYVERGLKSNSILWGGVNIYSLYHKRRIDVRVGGEKLLTLYKSGVNITFSF